LDIVGALDTVILHLTSCFCLINSSDEKLQHALNCHGDGNLRDAATAYREIIAVDPDHVDALHYLGVVSLQTGQFEVAIEHIGKAVRLRPGNVDAITNLGNAQQAFGQLDHAIESFRAALELSPASAILLANLGNAYRQEGRIEHAIDCFEQSLAIDPKLAEVRRNLADALLDDGRMSEALKQIIAAEKSDTQSLAVKASLANILRANAQYDAAIAAYEQVLISNPDFPPLLCNLANVHGDAGHTDIAIDLLKKVTDLDPAYSEGHYSLGLAFEQSGNKDVAENAFRKALSVDPYCGKAWRSIASLANRGQDSQLLNDIEAALTLPNLGAEQQAQLEYAAGKCCEDAGEFDKAMLHLQEANRIRRGSFTYDVEDDLATFRNIKHSFDKAFFAAREGLGVDDELPVFIVGMPRSGTSLVEQILASHGDVFGGGELPFLAQAIASRLPLRDGIDSTGSLAGASDKDLADVGTNYVSALRRLSATNRFITDKLPNNFLHIGLIKAALPNARIIHCVRDARDTCWSIYKNYFAGRGHYYAYDQAELGRYYAAYEDLMAHWQTVLPGTVYDVAYEDLIAHQEDTTRALLDTCELPWDPACLNFHTSNRPVKTLSASQVREPIHNRSIGAWKNVASSLSPLLFELGFSTDT
jgi:tetratricopeptide (TPR) repeat protein